jgi:hypothetical protein
MGSEAPRFISSGCLFDTEMNASHKHVVPTAGNSEDSHGDRPINAKVHEGVRNH